MNSPGSVIFVGNLGESRKHLGGAKRRSTLLYDKSHMTAKPAGAVPSSGEDSVFSDGLGGRPESKQELAVEAACSQSRQHGSAWGTRPEEGGIRRLSRCRERAKVHLNEAPWPAVVPA